MFTPTTVRIAHFNPGRKTWIVEINQHLQPEIDVHPFSPEAPTRIKNAIAQMHKDNAALAAETARYFARTAK